MASPVTAGTIGEHTGLTTGAVTGLMDKVVVHLLPNEHLEALVANTQRVMALDQAETTVRSN